MGMSTRVPINPYQHMVALADWIAGAATGKN